MKQMSYWSLNSNIALIAMFLLLFFSQTFYAKAAEQDITDSIKKLQTEYQAAELEDIYDQETLTAYVYQCFISGKSAAVRYHGSISSDSMKHTITQVFFIDQPTLYDSEGLWGYMDSYNLSLLPAEDLTYIFIKINYKYNMSDVVHIVNDWLASAKQEMENTYHISALSDKDIVKAAHDYLISKFDYDTSNQNTDDYIGILTGKMVCQGYALLYCKLLNTLGIDCKVILSDSHSWNVVKLENTWIQVDVSGDDLGHLGIPVISYNHFLKQRLISEKYHVIQPEIFFWNEQEFDNIYQPDKIILYRTFHVIQVIAAILFIILLAYLIIFLPISSMVHTKRQKIIRDFNDYTSI